MRKTLFIGLLTASLALQGCQQPSNSPQGSASPAPTAAAQATATPEASPTPEAQAGGLAFDFPATEPQAEPGQFVFVPMGSSIERVLEGEKKFSDMRPRELVKTGPETSTIKDRSEYEAPNALVVPIPPGAKAQVGDIVLGNPQYSSMEQGIVTDASDPGKPVVHFFKPVYGGAEPTGDKFEGQLEENKFMVLKDELGIGVHVLYPDGDEKGYGEVVKVDGDQVLITKFGGDLAVFDKSELTGIPLKPSVKEGDKVQAPFAKGMDPATVKKVDENIGRVWVAFEGREDSTSVFCFGEILPES